MKWITGVVCVVLLASGISLAQDSSVSQSLTHVSGPPALTPADKLLIDAVLALRESATAACSELPAMKRYTDVLGKVDAQFKAQGKTINWRTGALAPPAVK